MPAPPEFSSFTGHDQFKIQSFSPGQFGLVVFNYNPNSITYKRGNKGTSRGSATGAVGTQLEKAELISIDIQDIILEGWDTLARCTLLLNWASPAENILEATIASLFRQSVKLPLLGFQWGALFGPVYIRNCTVVYERFDKETAIPCRAKVNLSMELQPVIPGATNPTSGGLEGRRRHQMHQGENIVQVTTAMYGHPRYWRRLAQVNNIDDPLRVRPGQYVFVPNPNEIPED